MCFRHSGHRSQVGGSTGNIRSREQKGASYQARQGRQRRDRRRIQQWLKKAGRKQAITM